MASVGRSVYHEFNIAFSLIGLIPLTIAIYVLAARLFTLQIFEGVTGFYFFLAICFMLLGFLVGRGLLRGVLRRLIDQSIQLRQHDAVKSGFITNVAYELRPPLAAVQMALGNVSEGLLGPLTEEQRRALHDCHQVVKRLEDLTTDLIRITDLEQGHSSTQWRAFDLQQVLREALEASTFVLKTYDLTADVRVSDRPVFFFGDQETFRQAMTRCIDHAILWSSQGSTIGFEWSFLPQELRLVVWHDVASHKLEAFRALRGLAHSQTHTADSLGVGLELVRKIVTAHRGRLWIEAPTETTSRLVVSLPVVEAHQGSPPVSRAT